MTREEAIEKVRQMSLPKETMEILEALAPELRESEDERIRRILIESFEKANCSKVDEFTDCKLNKADVLAYLKKHKYDRMKPIYDARESFESALGKAWKDYNDSGARTVDGCEDDYVECAHAKGFREGYLFGLEKQKEPKLLNNEKYQTVPIEILDRLYASEKELQEIKQKEQNPDYAYQQLIKTVEEEADALYPNLYKEGTKEWSNREIEREYFMKGRMHSAIKANPELYHNWPEVKDALTQKRKEQKPVEKEITLTSFEGTLNTFLFDFANSPIEDCEPKEYIKKHSAEILKAAYKELNAKLQQDIFEARQEGVRDGYEVAKAEQKPAEWSEEDKKIIDTIISVLGQYIDYKAVSGTGSGYATPRYAKEIDWLKSIRPSWKPSEEQMEALNALNCHGGLSYVGQQNQLISLYNDLKKLM